MTQQTIHLGFEVGTGQPVEVPLAHTFVTGQTQLSGKTTTLRALVERSGCRALAFVTKRGERFEGRTIPPYLPREGKEPIHWRLVETILASALGQRAMKYERYWLIQAAKGATSLSGVRDNVNRLIKKAKGRTEEAYTLIREYLDLVVPEMEALAASPDLDLATGANVMDLSAVGAQLQALVIRAALERVNQHEKGVLTVFPEAWEFAPRSRAAPAKDEAIAMARKGAVLGNYLYCDSQDIAGVDTVIRQAASVWILGVQRELNELKRTIDSIPAGVAKPKPADVATLGLGQFYACWGRHSVKTYVQPAWMGAEHAKRVAMGEPLPVAPKPPPAAEPELPVAFTPQAIAAARHAPIPKPQPQSDSEEFDMADLKRLEDKIDLLLSQRQIPSGTAAPPSEPVTGPAPALNEEELYQKFKARLAKEAPALLQVLTIAPEIHVKVERQVIEANGDSLRGRLALMLKGGFFDDPKSVSLANKELKRRGAENAPANVARELDSLAAMGFLTIEPGENKQAKLYTAVGEMKGNVKEKS